jgi:pterin-4a-carbinolamine dehydratase
MTFSISDIFRENGHLKSEDSLTHPLSSLLNESMGLPKSLPIKSPRSNWDQLENPGRLVREFDFSSYEQLQFFVESVLKFQEELVHHGEIKINYRTIIIEVYTHSSNNITKLDTKYMKEVDLIYKDALLVRKVNL